MSTLPLLFAQTVERFGTNPALIEPDDENKFSILTYQELQECIWRFAGSLQLQQLRPGERIMIWSANSSNWLIAYFGALLLGLVVVPLDINTKEDFLLRLAETTEARFLITTQKQYASLKNPPVPIINIEALPQGSLNKEQLPRIDENDLAELVFTSGTTGQPKGVILSHRNIVSNAVTAIEVVKITDKDRALSLLPLSHMLEMTIEIALIHAGASIVYARSLVPDTLFMLLNAQYVTCIVLVPQALQLFLNGIEREVRRQKKEKQWQLLHKIASYLPFRLRRHLFRAVHKRFGGHFQLFVSGGAYLPPQLGQKWENMGFRVIQGYGTTECSPIIAANPRHVHNLASVGQPFPGVEVRIADDKEILVRGPNVASGYWKNPAATAAAFQDGWYYTGDLGELDAKKNLYLKGRKKNIIVLSNGMNVYPEDIENVLSNDETIKEAVVLGLIEDNNQGAAVHAILLMNDPTQAKAAIQSVNKQLAPHQQVKGFTIWPEKDFPRTHTLKVKRSEVLDRLQQIRALKK